MKNKCHHLLLDAIRELLAHPDLRARDSDLEWVREAAESLTTLSTEDALKRLNCGRLAAIRGRLGILPPSARAMTPAEFVEMAQELFSRSSHWTEDEAWVMRTLHDVAYVRPGCYVPWAVADHMRLICSPAALAPSQRDSRTNLSAKTKPRDLPAGKLTPPPRPVPPSEPHARFFEAWLGALRENREWLGIEPGCVSFGPVRRAPSGRRWRMRTLRAEYESPTLRPAEMSDLVEGCKVYIEVAPGCGHRRVTAVYLGGMHGGAWGYYEPTHGGKFIPFPKKVYVNVRREK